MKGRVVHKSRERERESEREREREKTYSMTLSIAKTIGDIKMKDCGALVECY
jgi:hypothetical protein